MKQPKRLTRKQKECLTAHCLNWNDWMLVEETDFCYRVINKKTGAVKSVDKFRNCPDFYISETTERIWRDGIQATCSFKRFIVGMA